MAKILIVDADRTIHQQLQQAFAGGRHEFMCATNNRSAWDFLNSEDFHLVILGVEESGGEGLDLLYRMRNDRMLVPVIIMGNPESETMERAMSLNACAYVSKPFTITQIRMHVDEALRGPDSLGDDAERLSMEEEESEWGSPSLLDEGPTGSHLAPMFEQRMEMAHRPSDGPSKVMEPFHTGFRERREADGLPDLGFFRSRGGKKR
ncbi:response regulator [Patescibacteria group bacterium]|nr:response regulator [Patescibacteria group bacterium]MBU1964139.1 response regulator [Patescibacteria group bacterium]